MTPASISPMLGIADSATLQRSMQGDSKQSSTQAAAEQFEAIAQQMALELPLHLFDGQAFGAKCHTLGVSLHRLAALTVCLCCHRINARNQRN